MPHLPYLEKTFMNWPGLNQCATWRKTSASLMLPLQSAAGGSAYRFLVVAIGRGSMPARCPTALPCHNENPNGSTSKHSLWRHP